MLGKVGLVIKLAIVVSAVALIWFLWSYINRPLPKAEAMINDCVENCAPASGSQPTGTPLCDKQDPNSPACPKETTPQISAPPQVLGATTTIGK